MSTRREIIKLIGSAPLAGSSAAGALAQAMATPAVAATLGMAAKIADAKAEFTGPAEQVIGRTLANRLRNLFDDQININDMTHGFREAGLDPDIAALRSVSRAHKTLRQKERDMENREVITRARRFLWG